MESVITFTQFWYLNIHGQQIQQECARTKLTVRCVSSDKITHFPELNKNCTEPYLVHYIEEVYIYLYW